jgi:hypothetical protein
VHSLPAAAKRVSVRLLSNASANNSTPSSHRELYDTSSVVKEVFDGDADDEERSAQARSNMPRAVSELCGSSSSVSRPVDKDTGGGAGIDGRDGGDNVADEDVFAFAPADW